MPIGLFWEDAKAEEIRDIDASKLFDNWARAKSLWAALSISQLPGCSHYL